ncbi:MAG TPA: STAS domain-containing protein [Verrucomicrobiae bacterium]
MNLTVSQTGDTQIFVLQGRLDSESTTELEKRCREEIKSDTRALILDLTGLEYVSSAGLRTILGAGKLMESRSGRLVLCAGQGLPRQILENAGFHKLFRICASLDEAGKFSSGTFRVHMHKEWEVDVMTVYGRVDAERAPEVETAGRKVLATPYQKLLINLSAVDYLSSAGLCALLNLAKLAESQHGRLFVCSPGASVRQVFKMSGFDKILTIRDTVQDALVE